MTRTAKRIATGAGWLYGFRWAERLLDLVSIVILARLLSPEDFGLVAIAASVATIVEGLSDFDVGKALIRSRDDSRPLYDTAWTLALLRGVATSLVMVTIALFLSESRISAVLAALAVGPLVKGLANPQFVAFERDLDYSRFAGLTLGSRLVAFGVTLTLAVLYRSYWALVIGILAGALVATLLSYLLRPYRPRFSLARGREIFAFSGWMSLTTMVTTLAMETDKIIVGRLLGVAEAGLYFMTQRIGVLPTRELISPLQRILFPSFSEMAGERERLRAAVRESVNVLGSLSLPAGIGFALLADEIVTLALGDPWQPIAPLLAILTPFLGLRATMSMTLPCVMSLGETRLLFRVSLIYALVHVPAFIAATAAWGLTGAIGSIVVAGIFYIYLNTWLLQRTLAISPREILGQIKRPLAATLAMAAVVLALGRLGSNGLFFATATWPSLLARVALGAAVYGAVLVAIWKRSGRPPGIERRLLQLRSD